MQDFIPTDVMLVILKNRLEDVDTTHKDRLKILDFLIKTHFQDGLKDITAEQIKLEKETVILPKKKPIKNFELHTK